MSFKQNPAYDERRKTNEEFGVADVEFSHKFDNSPDFLLFGFDISWHRKTNLVLKTTGPQYVLMNKEEVLRLREILSELYLAMESFDG